MNEFYAFGEIIDFPVHHALSLFQANFVNSYAVIEYRAFDFSALTTNVSEYFTNMTAQMVKES